MSNPTSNFQSRGASNEIGTGNLTRPAHHVHTDSEPLPGARGAADTVDYSADHMAGDFRDVDVNATEPHHHERGTMMAEGAKEKVHGATHAVNPKSQAPHGQGTNQVQYAEGATQQHQTTQKPGVGDKLIGKTEALAGKLTGKHALQEKGEVRAQVGKQ